MRRPLLVLSLAMAGVVACDHRQTTASNPITNRIVAGEIGSTLPRFSVKDLEGRELSSSELRGKVVLIDFWATWCEPCKKEMPGYQRLLDSYGPRGFVVIGLKFDIMADTEDPISFVKKIGIHYPLAVATDDLKQKFGGIEGLPTTMLYDRKGTLRKKVVGFEYTEVIEDDVKNLLDSVS